MNIVQPDHSGQIVLTGSNNTQYRLLKRIGKGSFGLVYDAENLSEISSSNKIVIKVIQDCLQETLNEIQMMIRIQEK